MKFLSSFSSIILITILLVNPSSAQDSLRYGPDYYEIDDDLTAELNLVYVGANWCAPCHKDTLKRALEKAKLAL